MKWAYFDHELNELVRINIVLYDHGLHGSTQIIFTKTKKTLFQSWCSNQSFCVKCYVLVFKNKLLSQFHITFHIHYRGFNPSKEKPSSFCREKPFTCWINYTDHYSLLSTVIMGYVFRTKYRFVSWIELDHYSSL